MFPLEPRGWEKYFLEKVELDCWVVKELKSSRKLKKKSVLGFRNITFATEGKDKKQAD